MTEELTLSINEVLNDYELGVDHKENANATHDTLTKRDTYIVNKFHKKHGLSIAVGAHEHIKGAIQIHDLGGGIDRPYCCGHDLSTLLMKGLGIPGNVQSGQANHLDTAVSQMIEMLQICSNEFSGAQAFSRVNTLLAPFVYKDDLTYKQVYQQMQQLVYHLNYPSRQALQTPFSNLSFDWSVPDDMQDEVFEWTDEDGELCDIKYGSLQDELDLINMAFMNVLKEGDDNGNVFTFPIPTYSVEDLEMFDMNMEPARGLWDLTAKFGSPYFMNYLGSGINPASRRAMCCRLSLDYDDIADATGGVWNIGSGTGSIAITSINLNRCALEAGEGRLGEMFERLEKYFWTSVEQCLQRKTHVFDAYAKGRLPYAQEYLADGSSNPLDAFRSFFLTIGIVGAYEAWVNLGFTDQELPYNVFVDDLLKFMKRLLVEARDYDSGNFGNWKLWNLEQTPAEGCSPRFAALDLKHYPDAFVQGLGTGEVYLTNSTHLPVNTPVQPLQQAIFRGESDRLYSGGTLLNWYTDEAATPESVCALIKMLCTKTKLPYIAFSPTVGTCQECGNTVYGCTGGICGDCGSEVDLKTRVVGYIRSASQFNPGQRRQYENREYMKTE